MLKYILEIKNRLFLLFITWASSIFVSYFYKEILLFLIMQINENYYPTSFYFIFTNLIEIFNVYIKLIIFITNQICFIYFVYHLFLFIMPALFRTEYNYFYFIVKYFLAIWVISIIFFNNFFIPLTWNFFLSFHNFISVNLHFEAKLNEFITFYISLYYLCVFYCIIFIIIVFIINYININIRSIKKFKKLYYYLFIIFATLISPPDLLSQFFISLFIILIYEFLVFTLCFKYYIN